MNERPIRKTRSMRLVEIEHGNRPIEELLPEWLERMSVRKLGPAWGVHWTLIYDWMHTFDIPMPSKANRDENLVSTK